MIARVTVDRDSLRRTTAPHLLCERARTIAGFGGVPLQAFRHLSRATLARLRRAGGACRVRAAEPRHRPRRARRHHGGRLRRVDDLRSRGPVARRDRLRHLSDSFCSGSRVSDARRRGCVCLSRKTRNTSTESCRLPIDCLICAQSSCSTTRPCSRTRTTGFTASASFWPPSSNRILPG